MSEDSAWRRVQYLIETAKWGFPSTPQHALRCANQILRDCSGDLDANVGQNWLNQFLNCHNNQLSSYWSTTLTCMHGVHSMKPMSIIGTSYCKKLLTSTTFTLISSLPWVKLAVFWTSAPIKLSTWDLQSRDSNWLYETRIGRPVLWSLSFLLMEMLWSGCNIQRETDSG